MLKKISSTVHNIRTQLWSHRSTIRKSKEYAKKVLFMQRMLSEPREKKNNRELKQRRFWATYVNW